MGTVAGPHPFPRWCATSTGRSAKRRASRSTTARRTPSRMRCSHASAAVRTRSASSMRFSTTLDVRLYRPRGGRRRRRDREARTQRRPRHAWPPARHAHLPAPGRERPDDRVALDLGWSRLSRSRPRALVAQRHRARRSTSPSATPRPWTRFSALTRNEGIIPAIESAHAIAGAIRLGRALGPDATCCRESLGPRRQGYGTPPPTYVRSV